MVKPLQAVEKRWAKHPVAATRLRDYGDLWKFGGQTNKASCSSGTEGAWRAAADEPRRNKDFARVRILHVDTCFFPEITNPWENEDGRVVPALFFFEYARVSFWGGNDESSYGSVKLVKAFGHMICGSMVRFPLSLIRLNSFKNIIVGLTLVQHKGELYIGSPLKKKKISLCIMWKISYLNNFNLII